MKRFFLFGAALLAFIACDDQTRSQQSNQYAGTVQGPMGPQGPQGPKGDQGVRGAPGPQGPAGGFSVWDANGTRLGVLISYMSFANAYNALTYRDDAGLIWNWSSAGNPMALPSTGSLIYVDGCDGQPFSGDPIVMMQPIGAVIIYSGYVQQSLYKVVGPLRKGVYGYSISYVGFDRCNGTPAIGTAVGLEKLTQTVSFPLSSPAFPFEIR